MFYRYALLVPAATPVNAPVEQDIELPAGIIHLVSIKFPPGCHGFVYFAIYQGANRMWPASPSRLDNARGYVVAADRIAQRNAMIGFFRGDAEEIVFKEHVENKHGYHWTLVGCSPDARHDHVIPVRFGVLKEEEISPFTIVKDLVAILKHLIGMK